METTTTRPVHPFQARGLGLAPFRLLGVDTQDRAYGQAILNRAEYEKTGIMMTTQPGGTCEYCGKAIIILCDVVSADGKRFHVGTDCAEKTCGPRIVAAVKSAKTKINAAKAQARAAAKIATTTEALSRTEVRAALSAKPHGFANMAAAGLTMMDQVEWLMKFAGVAGKLRAAKMVAAVSL